MLKTTTDGAYCVILFQLTLGTSSLLLVLLVPLVSCIGGHPFAPPFVFGGGIPDGKVNRLLVKSTAHRAIHSRDRRDTDCDNGFVTAVMCKPCPLKCSFCQAFRHRMLVCKRHPPLWVAKRETSSCCSCQKVVAMSQRNSPVCGRLWSLYSSSHYLHFCVTLWRTSVCYRYTLSAYNKKCTHPSCSVILPSPIEHPSPSCTIPYRPTLPIRHAVVSDAARRRVPAWVIADDAGWQRLTARSGMTQRSWMTVKSRDPMTCRVTRRPTTVCDHSSFRGRTWSN